MQIIFIKENLKDFNPGMPILDLFRIEKLRFLIKQTSNELSFLIAR